MQFFMQPAFFRYEFGNSRDLYRLSTPAIMAFAFGFCRNDTALHRPV